MRVLFWSDVFWPTIGGIEVLSAELIRSLQARHYEFLVVTSKPGPELPDLTTYDGIPVRRFPFAEGLARASAQRFLDLCRRVEDLRREFRPDLIHVACIAPDLLFLLQTSGVDPAPLLVTMQQPTTPFGSGAPAALLSQVLRTADWRVYCSEAMRTEVEALVPGRASRSSVIANALPAPPVRSEPPDCPAKLLCLGRLAPQKGFDIALEAFARIAERFPDVELSIAGDGPQREELGALADHLRLARRVRFHGWIAPTAVPTMIARSTAVLMPSRREPFGLVALEAGFLARPVIASGVDGLNEVVVHGETGLLVPPDGPEALAEAVAYLLSHPDRARQLGQAGRRRALERFQWSAYVEAYHSLYQNLHLRGGAC